MQKFLKENKKAVLISGGLAIVFIAGLKFYQHLSSLQEDAPSEALGVKLLHRQTTITQVEHTSLILKIKNNVAKELAENKVLSNETLLDINVAIALGCTFDYRKLVSENRALRREVLGLDNKKYVSIIRKYFEDFKKLKNEVRMSTYGKVGVDEKIVTTSVLHLIQIGSPHSTQMENEEIINAILRKKLRATMTGLHLDELKKVMSEMVSLIENTDLTFEHVHFANEAEKLKIGVIHAQDQIFLKHGIEDEDIVECSFGKKYEEDEEYKELAFKINHPEQTYVNFSQYSSLGSTLSDEQSTIYNSFFVTRQFKIGSF